MEIFQTNNSWFLQSRSQIVGHDSCDDLSGLASRLLFHQDLTRALSRCERSGVYAVTIFVELDQLKMSNDDFGPIERDALRVNTSQHIQTNLRENDTMAYLGSNEFAILLTELHNLDEAVSVSVRLLAALQASCRLQDQDPTLKSNYGLAFYPDDAIDSDTLLRHACLAMQRAKQEKRSTYACYSNVMDLRLHDDMQLHFRFKDSLDQGRLQLHYQPQVGVESGEIVGAEALLRWSDPVFGNVPPSKFVALAEATGLMVPLADWVLETVCEQIAAWTKVGTPLRVAINVSFQQFHQRYFPQRVQSALERAGASPDQLDIEITESVAMTNYEQASEHIRALVNIGCHVSIDHFGTGYSSLSQLKALPISRLKIDKSFLGNIACGTGGTNICRAIIALAHSLGMTLVAEGVETHDQLEYLHQHECEIYQGWLFAKAMSVEDLNVLLYQTRRLVPAKHAGIEN
jgi:diguanylate cyclase (GGDEF)-like protein